MPPTAEPNKKELLLSLNLFQKPAEMIGKDAWARLALNLLFLRKGTYPSAPVMGVGIQDYDYEFLDEIRGPLQEEIQSQMSTYLPNLPLTEVTVDSVDYEGQPILVVGLAFNDDGQISYTAVAARITNKLIDFEISW